ncbi:MAG: pyruvate ferredoxin oxidoreductase [Lentisphaerae bacterium]|jgi:indolepyruvate ferredoxin oxidoreductase beta subunit|nr:pyruvate ferredoxin oxidoreductase [Lentisphaerota bacterium]
MKDITNVIIAGLGGQGVVKASDILATAAFLSGFDVKKSELHGMSQRGGSVSSDIRFGKSVFSPMIPYGAADYLLVLCDSQTDRVMPLKKADGLLIVSEDLSGLELTDKRQINSALLAVLSRHLEISNETWKLAFNKNFNEITAQKNFDTFLKVQKAQVQ